MSPKMQKGALITIIVLLLLFIPLTGVGIYYKFINVPKEVVLENTNKELHFDNKLWFYDEAGELLGTYLCETSNCDIATNWQADSEYAIRSLKPEDSTQFSLVNDRFIFLKDFEDPSSHEAFLYDILSSTSYKSVAYSSVKNYGVGIENDIFIVENAMHKYNVVQLKNILEPILEFEYDFIGLIESYNENNQILADFFVVLKNGTWNILDANGALLTENFAEEIVTFNGTYIITVDTSNQYHLMNYQNEKMLEENFANLSFTDRYLNCTTLNDEFYVYDLTQNRIVGESITINAGDIVETKMNDKGNLDLYINDVLKDTIILV